MRDGGSMPSTCRHHNLCSVWERLRMGRRSVCSLVRVARTKAKLIIGEENEAVDSMDRDRWQPAHQECELLLPAVSLRAFVHCLHHPHKCGLNPSRIPSGCQQAPPGPPSVLEIPPSDNSPRTRGLSRKEPQMAQIRTDTSSWETISEIRGPISGERR